MTSLIDNLSANKLAPIERGLVAGTVFVLIDGVGFLALDRTSAIEGVAERLTTIMPATLFSFLLDNLLYSAKPVLLIGLIFGVYVASIVLGAVYQATGTIGTSQRTGLTFGITAVLLFALDMLIVRPGSTAAELILSAVAAAAFVSVFALASRTTPAEATSGIGRPFSRRMMVTGLLGLSGSLAVGGYYWSTILAKSAPITARTTSEPPSEVDTETTSGEDPWSNISYLSPEITPTDEFYFVSKNFVDPVVSVDGWSLTVEGLVDNPLSFTYEEFKNLASDEQYNTLMCISNDVGGDLIGNAHWRGARLKPLLEQAKPQSGVTKVVFHAADGYADSITFDVAMRSANLLAYEMNGEQLNDTHGFPLRLLVPGIFGMKNVKWITRIELVSEDFLGYWQKQGWSDPAPVNTMSRVDGPTSDAMLESGSQVAAGVAFAGDRQINTVEISTDEGASWTPANVKPAIGPYAWSLWQAPIELPADGSPLYVWVRATDGNGQVQTADDIGSYPDGASGYHKFRVMSHS